jgi:hypothetical protein
MPTPSVPPRSRLRAAVLGLLTMLAVLVPAAVAAPVASAAPCRQSNCPEPPPNEPGPHHPPAPVVKHRLTIKTIVCHDKNDDKYHELSDEVYINVAGQRVWGINSVGELNGYQVVNVTKDLVGGPNAYLGRIDMWDQDDIGADDHLAALDVFGNGSPTDVSGSYEFHMSDSHYTMEISLRQL